MRSLLNKIGSHLAQAYENVVLFPAVNLTALPWDFILILAFLAIIIPWRGKVRVGRLMKQSELTSSDRLSLYGSTIAGQWVLAGIVLWRALARGLGPIELGLTIPDPWRAAGITATLTLILCTGQIAGLRKLAQMTAEERGPLFRITEKITPRTITETAVFAALATTAGLSEEFLYRGFAYATFARLLAGAPGEIAFAGGISSVWFAAAHLYQGRRGIITTFIVGIIFFSVRVWSGSLLPPIIAHAAVDLTVGICVPRFLKKAA